MLSYSVLARRLFPILVLLVIFGCKKDWPRSQVKGTILYKGKPVTETTLMFMAVDNNVYRAELDKEGKYIMDGIPQGIIKVCLQQAPPRMPRKADPDLSAKAGMGEAKDAAQPPSVPIMPRFQLPTNYADPEQSGLQFELKEPVQEWSVELK